MEKKTIAKFVAWVGGAITTLSLQNSFGKYSTTIGSLGAILTAVSVHLSSETSAGHPNGSN